MGNLLRAEVCIRGIRPLLINHFRPTQDLKSKCRPDDNDPSEWKRTVLMMEKRQLYLLPTYIFGCLRDAGNYTKRGHISLMKSVAATLHVQERQVLLDRSLPLEPRFSSEEGDDEAYIFMTVTRSPTGRVCSHIKCRYS